MQQNKFHPGPEEIEQARQRLTKIARLTPLLQSNLNPRFYFKAESLQRTGSFKIRTAYNQLAELTPEERSRGVVTSSSGNFAQGVACAARELGVSAKIVMMKSSSSLKVQRTRELGGEVVFCEDRFEARENMVEEIRQREGRATVHPYNAAAAVAGNATIGMEILEQLPSVGRVVAPISGGGLISGIALAVKKAAPEVEVLGVQPEGSSATYLSFQEGRIQEIPQAHTIADGLRVTRPGTLTFDLISRFVDDVRLVSDEDIRRAVTHFLEEERLVVEPSGAATFALALAGGVSDDADTVFVVSGSNLELGFKDQVSALK